MAVPTATGAPELIEQGGTYLFTESFSEFPNTQWTAQYLLQIPGSAPYSTNATNTTNGTDFLFTLSPVIEVPGRYFFAIYTTERASGQRATAKTGVLNVLPDLSQTQAATTAQTMLDNVNAAITSLTSGGFQSVSVNNVSYTRYQVTELIALRTRLQAEVIREREAQEVMRGINHDGLIVTRFK